MAQSSKPQLQTTDVRPQTLDFKSDVYSLLSDF